jgi:hypothetical protein
VEARFSPFGDIVKLSARQVHRLGQTYHTQESFWAQTMELLGDAGQMVACFGLLGDCVNFDTR